MNRLQTETSPYLLQHADNPVDWHPWGEKALELARSQDKPVFLSIGYAACHWCHVMAHESFEDAQTAEIMNQHFINIKVDREERPDIDSIYMNAVVAITGHGGWPLSVFLTPEGNPFYGGTYFPPSRRHNMPSFQEVLRHISHQWETNREQLMSSSEALTRHIQQPLQLWDGEAELDLSTLDRASEALFKQYDWKHGGWGDAPKFPASSVIEVQLQRFHRSADQLALDMATHALDRMQQGGIHDQIGGGFHRYAVDNQWLIPHFEKMLYDNALLLRAYLHHWQITQSSSSLDVVERMLEFLVREMRHPAGGFYSSLDADSEGREGTYYAWSLDELVEAAPPGTTVEFIEKVYGVSAAGNFEGRNVLSTPFSPSELAESLKLSEAEFGERLAGLSHALLSRRQSRERPATDDKIITAWNGLLLVALAEAARALKRDDVLKLAQALGSFALEELSPNGRLQRSWKDGAARFTAYLEDHAALGLGMLGLYQADFNVRWLVSARFHAREILDHFGDESGGFFDTRDDHETLITRPKSLQDMPTPSGSALAVTLLLQLTALDGDQPWYSPALKALGSMRENMARHPSAFAAWLGALDFALGPRLQLAVTGEPDSESFASLIEVANQTYLPRLVQAGGNPGDDNNAGLLTSRPESEQSATAFLCRDFSCQLPTQSPQVLKSQIQEALSET